LKTMELAEREKTSVVSKRVSRTKLFMVSNQSKGYTEGGDMITGRNRWGGKEACFTESGGKQSGYISYKRVWLRIN